MFQEADTLPNLDPWFPYLVLCFVSYSSNLDVYTFSFDLPLCLCCGLSGLWESEEKFKIDREPFVFDSYLFVVKEGAVASGVGLWTS